MSSPPSGGQDGGPAIPGSYDTRTATRFWDDQSGAYESRPFYAETGAYFRWCLDLVLRHLRPARGARLADLGAGTGNFSAALYEAVGGAADGGGRDDARPVVCVDPSAGLLALARQRPGLLPVVSGAFEFVVGADDGDGDDDEEATDSQGAMDHEERRRKKRPVQFDGVLMKEMVHFIPREQWPAMWAALRQRLAPGGRAVIMYRPKRTEFPFSRGMLETWERLWTLDGLEESIKAAGFARVESIEERFPLSMTKAEWLTLLASRFWSNLSEEHLPPDQLEHDLEELRATLPEGQLSWHDTFTVLVCETARAK